MLQICSVPSAERKHLLHSSRTTKQITRLVKNDVHNEMPSLDMSLEARKPELRWSLLIASSAVVMFTTCESVAVHRRCMRSSSKCSGRTRNSNPNVAKNFGNLCRGRRIRYSCRASLSFMNHMSSGGWSYSADLHVRLTRSLILYFGSPPSIVGLSGLVSG